MQQASAHRVPRMHAWDILAPTEVFRLWVRPVGARGSGDEDAVGIEYAHCTVLPDLSRRHQAAQICPDDAVPCPQSHCVCSLFWVCFFFLTSVHTASLTLTVTPSALANRVRASSSFWSRSGPWYGSRPGALCGDLGPASVSQPNRNQGDIGRQTDIKFSPDQTEAGL